METLFSLGFCTFSGIMLIFGRVYLFNSRQCRLTKASFLFFGSPGWLTQNPKKFPELVVGWFQPIWQKICSSNMGILFPKFRGENQKIFELPPPRQSLEWQPSAWFLLIGQNHRDPDFMAYNNPIFNWVVWNHHLAEGLIQFFFLSLGCSVLLHQLLTCSPWRVVGELIVGVLFGKKNGRFLFQMGNWKTWIEFWIYIYIYV